MTEILLVRHGETEWNVAEVFRGRIDVPLNDAGTRQAELLAEYLEGVRIEAIYSSVLKRAWQTAEAIARHQSLEINVLSELIDFDFGEWQGLSRQEVEERFPEEYTDWLSHPERMKTTGGENLEQVRERSVRAVDEVIKAHHGTIALVSHRVVHKVLICALLGLDNSHFWNIKLDTCGITTFAYERGRFVLARHNDNSFLEPMRKAPLADF